MDEEKKHNRLADRPKKDPFEAPEGYFDSLQQKIDQRIDAGSKGKVVSVNWRYIGYAVAASITLLVAFLIGFSNLSKDELSVEQMLAEISLEDCIAYIETSDMDIDEIVQGTSPETWSEPMVSPHGDDTDLEEDMDLLYEEYGVTSDENLQTL